VCNLACSAHILCNLRTLCSLVQFLPRSTAFRVWGRGYSNAPCQKVSNYPLPNHIDKGTKFCQWGIFQVPPPKISKTFPPLISKMEQNSSSNSKTHSRHDGSLYWPNHIWSVAARYKNYTYSDVDCTILCPPGGSMVILVPTFQNF
jgi:hypothetical protein